jgi:hypothetical protein
MSDICLSDGISLDCDMLLGSPSSLSSTSSWVNIHQARPNQTSWKLWRKACSLWSFQNKLYHPLGAWSYSAPQLRRKWLVYCEYATGDLYVRSSTGYIRCIAINPIHYSPVSEGSWTPTSTSYPVPAQKSIHGDTWIPIIPSLPAPPPHPDQPASFQQFFGATCTVAIPALSDPPHGSGLL